MRISKFILSIIDPKAHKTRKGKSTEDLIFFHFELYRTWLSLNILKNRKDLKSWNVRLGNLEESSSLTVLVFVFFEVRGCGVTYAHNFVRGGAEGYAGCGEGGRGVELWTVWDRIGIIRVSSIDIHSSSIVVHPK